MPDILALNIKASLDWLFKDTLDLSTVTDASKLEYAAALTDGTAAGQADKIWHDSRSIAAGSNDDLDLTALTNTIFDSTVTINFAKVKAILIVNTSTAAGEDLLVGGAAAAEWTAPFGGAGHKIKCPADSCLMLTNRAAGWAVTNGSADVLRVHNSGAATIAYRIVIVGASA